MKYSFLNKLGANYCKYPSEGRLGWKAEQLIEQALEDLPEEVVFDCHAHLLGLGTAGTGCWVNPNIRNWQHPLDHLKLMLYINASGIEHLEQADQQYLQQLMRQVQDFPQRVRCMLLALDKAYHKDGRWNKADTKFYVPNSYVYTVSQLYPKHFSPCISVHPYRPDALEELEKWALLGVRMVKWLPNIMGMDPADSLCEPFYQKMRELDMYLLGHAGGESAMEVLKFKHLGNPLKYRKPLDMGVKVIMAHCASLGFGLDTDGKIPKPAANFSLFMRLMEEKQYEGLLFADISAMTQINRAGNPLTQMLRRQDLHHRLINGSDYPLPAVNAVISTRLLQWLGYISRSERIALNQIYKRNPLLFDFVLKRTLKDPQNSQNRFSVELFRPKPALQLSEPLLAGS
jgi:uncharacterized protein